MTDKKHEHETDHKASDAKKSGTKRFYNAGQRTYNVSPKEDGKTHHAFAPGQVVDIHDEKEAERLSQYTDIHDVDAMAKPKDNSEVEALKAQLEAAKIENAQLRDSHETSKTAEHKSGKK